VLHRAARRRDAGRAHARHAAPLRPTSRSIVDVLYTRGFRSWADGDAVDELICAMFDENLSLLLECAVKAHDASLERLLLAAMKNWLIDQAKATEVGKLRRRLENVLCEGRHAPVTDI
jgi:hypothetical protein